MRQTDRDCVCYKLLMEWLRTNAMQTHVEQVGIPESTGYHENAAKDDLGGFQSAQIERPLLEGRKISELSLSL